MFKAQVRSKRRMTHVEGFDTVETEHDPCLGCSRAPQRITTLVHVNGYVGPVCPGAFPAGDGDGGPVQQSSPKRPCP